MRQSAVPSLCHAPPARAAQSSGTPCAGRSPCHGRRCPGDDRRGWARHHAGGSHERARAHAHRGVLVVPPVVFTQAATAAARHEHLPLLNVVARVDAVPRPCLCVHRIDQAGTTTLTATGGIPRPCRLVSNRTGCETTARNHTETLGWTTRRRRHQGAAILAALACRRQRCTFTPIARSTRQSDPSPTREGSWMYGTRRAANAGARKLAKL